MSDHFRVERLRTPIPLFINASKTSLKWAVVCNVTGGRFGARRTKDEAELVASMYGESACWLCAEAKRGEIVRPIPAT